MAPRLDDEPGSRIDLRASPAQRCGRGGQARQSINRADGPRCRAELRSGRRNALTKVAKDLQLAGIHLLLRAEHDRLFLP